MRCSASPLVCISYIGSLFHKEFGLPHNCISSLVLFTQACIFFGACSFIACIFFSFFFWKILRIFIPRPKIMAVYLRWFSCNIYRLRRFFRANSIIRAHLFVICEFFTTFAPANAPTTTNMNIEAYREYCLSLGKALFFYLCEHMFAFFDCNDYQVISLKCQPERIDEIIVPSRLRTQSPIRFYRQPL